jgi:hypothetical protein
VEEREDRQAVEHLGEYGKKPYAESIILGKEVCEGKGSLKRGLFAIS